MDREKRRFDSLCGDACRAAGITDPSVIAELVDCAKAVVEGDDATAYNVACGVVAALAKLEATDANPERISHVTGWSMAVVFAMITGRDLWIGESDVPGTPYTLEGELAAAERITPEGFAHDMHRRFSDPDLVNEQVLALQAVYAGDPIAVQASTAPCGTCPQHQYNTVEQPCPDHPELLLCPIDTGVPAPVLWYCGADHAVFRQEEDLLVRNETDHCTPPGVAMSMISSVSEWEQRVAEATAEPQTLLTYEEYKVVSYCDCPEGLVPNGHGYSAILATHRYWCPLHELPGMVAPPHEGGAESVGILECPAGHFFMVGDGGKRYHGTMLNGWLWRRTRME